ncbi:MAG TPA: hypothetical protein DD381_08725 [Lentisphaeria bacterium]|nr:MAG: hypothetical protein A2X47_08120 [Lentisphaerae bacterium GWF2_38_69]HBM16407.1 hypothetical protein [Lentisphaeria bacterium]
MKFNKLNSSPIISLAKIGHADLLLKVAHEINIPSGVYEEITALNRNDSATEWIKALPSEFLTGWTVFFGKKIIEFKSIESVDYNFN